MRRSKQLGMLLVFTVLLGGCGTEDVGMNNADLDYCVKKADPSSFGFEAKRDACMKEKGYTKTEQGTFVSPNVFSRLWNAI